ncbi:CDGSH iron-sulfur domain-containing protein [Streptomyces fuscigenes]|uniref:CDGSH iron-sulfur domain-containing protein n=1 Tax=Streptomyces fuscigenes TaxID=1528880 RepID=UPI001F264265|nr:CDGSH iron-sulfur domain-containing protein [Streptomyces fuscigenes]MCF3962312.1 CDGSH iron-sulfur domain-containing protein [Streptomyces fuscigenes]
MNTPGGSPRRVTIDPGGPVVLEGPVEVTLGDGTVAVSQRPTVALCTCRRSRRYPWCDTSHRRRSRQPRTEAGAGSRRAPEAGGAAAGEAAADGGAA